MLYTESDSLFFHFFVEDLTQEINARLSLRDAFDFSVISPNHFSNLKRAGRELHAGEVSYFKEETKGETIVEFVVLRYKIFSFSVRGIRAYFRAELPDGCSAQNSVKGRGALSNQTLQAPRLLANVQWWSPFKFGQLPHRLQTPPGAPK